MRRSLAGDAPDRKDLSQFGGALLGPAGESARHRQRRHQRVLHERLALLLGASDDRDQ